MTIYRTIVDENNTADTYDTTAAPGGGIYNQGSMVISESTLARNRVGHTIYPHLSGAGGGIYNAGGALTIERSTISDNSAIGGGGIYNGSGLIKLLGCTVSGNSSEERDGGGILNEGSLSVEFSTITENDIYSEGGFWDGGGIYNRDGNDPVTLFHAIVANNRKRRESFLIKGTDDCSGAFHSLGYNLFGVVGGFTLNGTSSGNLLGFDPRLVPLADNGGPTMTHALYRDSPALNNGDRLFSSPPHIDQRGQPRVAQGKIDIGAFEVQDTSVRPIGETGGRNVYKSSSYRMSFIDEYRNPVAFVQAITSGDETPAHIRLTSVTSQDLTFRQEGWESELSRNEDVNYLVMEEGVYDWEEETRIEVGKSVVGPRWHRSSFSRPFSLAPVVLAQVQTRNSEAPVFTQVKDVTEQGFSVRLREASVSENNDGYANRGSEVVGYIAFEQSSSDIRGFTYEAKRTPRVITSGFSTVSFNKQFRNTPVFLAQSQTADDLDPFDLRYRGLASTGVEVKVQEDGTTGSTVHSTPEAIGYVAIEDLGLLWIDDPLESFVPADYVAYYQLDGTLDEESGSHHGGYSNSTLSFTHAISLMGIDLNGASDMVQVADDPDLDITQGLSLMAWVKLRSYSPVSKLIVKPLNPVINPWELYALDLDADGKTPRFMLSTGERGSWRGVSSGRPLELERWYQLAGTYDGSTMKLYVNGELMDSLDIALSIGTNDQPVRIGGIDGIMDEVLIYHRAVTRGEMREMIYAQSTRVNVAPSVDAGLDQTVNLGTSVNLTGSITDDGLPVPPGELSLSWRLSKGPVNVDLDSTTSPNAVVNFVEPGQYKFELSANDGHKKNVDTVRVAVEPKAPIIIGEGFRAQLSGSLYSSGGWREIGLKHPYQDPVVIMHPPTYEDDEPIHIRLRSVRNRSFEAQLETWPPITSSFHRSERVSYIVLEAGRYSFGDRAAMEVGYTEVDGQWKTVFLPPLFAEPPAILAQVQTRNESDPVVVHIKDVTPLSFKVRLREEEAKDDKHGISSHAAEKVGYVAVTQGDWKWNKVQVEAGVTSPIYTDVPTLLDLTTTDLVSSGLFLANTVTENEPDTAQLRYTRFVGRSVIGSQPVWTTGIVVEEETSADQEIVHKGEAISYLALESEGFIRVSEFDVESGPNGLVAYYTFEGHTLDETGTHHGEFVGASAKYAEGTLGQGLVSASSGGFIEVPDHSDLDLKEGVTLVAWIRLAAFSSGSKIVAKPLEPLTNPWELYALDLGADGATPRFMASTGERGSWRGVESDRRIVLDQWHHLAGTYDGEEMKLYLDGELVGSLSAEFVIGVNDQPLRIGGIEGIIDELVVYARALTQREVKTHAFADVEPVNKPPRVDVGPDLAHYLLAPLFLSAKVEDDGLLVDQEKLIGRWDRLHGAGSVSFEDRSSRNTLVNFTEIGRHGFRFTARDGEFTSSDQLTVDVTRSLSPDMVPRGYTAHYRFEASTLDEGGLHNGTYIGDVEEYSEGVSGLGIRLGSGDEIIEIADHPQLDFTGKFSLAAWVNLESYTPISKLLVKALNPVTNPWELYALDLSASGDTPRFMASTGDPGSWRGASSEKSIKLDQWSHLVGTSDGETLKLYVDGDLVGSEPAPPFIGQNNQPLLMGNIRGIVDEVLIYGRALSVEEVEFLYQANLSKRNQPPFVDAGEDQVVILHDSLLLDGKVVDDGAPDPPGSVFIQWSKVSGPGL